jgi:hypothetical protein
VEPDIVQVIIGEIDMRVADRIRVISVALVLCVAGASPALAQVDLSGVWTPIFHEDQVERIPGPDLGDYAGLPITEAARQRALTWDASLLTLPEHQCKPHPSTYGFRGVGNLRIWADQDPSTQAVIKLHTHVQWMEQHREIWMDGRPHPAAHAAHTWQGFSTGRWEGDTLVVSTTHLKAGWMRRNGVPLSDEATMEDRFIRHGDLLTHVYIISDPHYLSEPLVRSNGFRLSLNARIDPYPCESVEEVVRDQGEVPHVLPGANNAPSEYAAKHGLPVEAALGGAETALPEFAQKLKALPPARK